MGTPLYIGINGGGTKTTLVATDTALTVLSQVVTGPSNHNNVGLARVRDTLRTALDQLFSQAGLDRADAATLCAGLAGIDRPTDQETFKTLFGELLPGVPLLLENDGTIALTAGAGHKRGLIVISGTGSIVIGVDESGKQARCGGWGWLVDEGSGYAIGRAVMQAIARAHDGAQPPTALTDRIMKRLSLNDPTALINWLYAPGRNPNEIAALAAEAIALAEDDWAATQIIVSGADALAHNAATVIGRLAFGTEPIPVVLSGGLFDHGALLRDRFIQTLHAQYPTIQPMLATRDAAIGAAMLGIISREPERVFTPGATLIPGSPLRATEQRNQLTMHSSRRPTLELLHVMNYEDSRLGVILAGQLTQIAALIDAFAPQFRKGGRLLMFGAGTSGRLAVLDAVECGPTFGVSPEQVRGIMSGGYETLMGAAEGAEDDQQDGIDQVIALDVGALDCVIGVAASGSTPFVIGALTTAKARGAITASVVCVVNAPISALAAYPIVAASGAEALTGSTRLRAGTAQKLALNMITTGIMIRAGRTVDNLMTDMAARNLKLNDRAKRIVADAARISFDEAAALLDQADGEIKTAVAMAALGVNPGEARLALADVEGDLNRVMGR